MANLTLTLLSLLLLLLGATTVSDAALSYNVLRYGASSDGRGDSTKAFSGAWLAACGSMQPSTVYVPPGTFQVGPIQFSGPCKNRIALQVEGTIAAPDDWSMAANSGFWILFYKVNGITVSGGMLDGRASAFWACRRARTNCPLGARVHTLYIHDLILIVQSLSFVWSNDVTVSGLRSRNSQLMHVAIDECTNVRIQNVNLRAPSSSPNTDGIGVHRSTGVTISHSTIMTGDDCISIAQGCRNIWMQHIACGPGHGISIGSLGDSANEEGVQNVTLSGAVFTGTDNGVRIKTWARRSNGFVRDVVFRNIIMNNVHNPIIIDQNYCPGKQCPHEGSGVKISRVKYLHIRGTSAAPVAMSFGCSSSTPCQGIQLKNIHLTYSKGPAKSYCHNVVGRSTGVVFPTSCL